MEKIVEKLDNINKTLEGIKEILKTPENKVMTVFKYVGAWVSALGILSIVELIRQWIMGRLYDFSINSFNSYCNTWFDNFLCSP